MFISHETTLMSDNTKEVDDSTFSSVYVGMYSSTDGNLWKTITAKLYKKRKIVTKLLYILVQLCEFYGMRLM